jgi:site-specific DNA-methyltransferase (adenine-specific)
MSEVSLHLGDCLQEMARIEDGSVDLIAVDPPYFKVKGAAWDRQWDNPAAFLAWVGRLCDEWCRVLAPNGSLYCFASPRMAWGVEGEIRKRFNVLNCIRWEKPLDNSDRRHVAQVVDRQMARSYYPSGEKIIFAEHFGADNIAKGEAGYAAKCDEMRGFVFEPLRAYLDGERRRAGVTMPQIDAAWCRSKGVPSTRQSQKWFTPFCWNLPTSEAYAWLRATLSSLNHDGEYLRRDYEELRRDYEELRVQYESLRRPFSVTVDVPYTDVWDFPTVPHRPGKHPCEKPLAMMEHIVRASSREGATVLDCCMGSGTTGIACFNTGRNFIGIEKCPDIFATAGRRINEARNARAELLIA